MIVPPYIRRALKGWTAWREARRRRERFARMLQVDPSLRAAHEARCRHVAGHQPSMADLMAMRAAMTARLEREVRHG